MSCINLDLTIDGALADPVINAAMRADRVDPRRFEALLRATAQTLGRTADLRKLPLPVPSHGSSQAICGAM